MRTEFTIQGQEFDSLATEGEAAKWAIIERPFPSGADIQLSLAKASLWLGEIISVAGEPSDSVVRCVVRLATYFAAGDLVPVALPPTTISNSPMQLTFGQGGQFDIREANRLGFPDVESYRLVKPLLGQPAATSIRTIEQDTSGLAQL